MYILPHTILHKSLKKITLKVHESLKMERNIREDKHWQYEEKLMIMKEKIRTKTADQAIHVAKTFRLDRLDQITAQTKPKPK